MNNMGNMNFNHNANSMNYGSYGYRNNWNLYFKWSLASLYKDYFLIKYTYIYIYRTLVLANSLE